MSQEYYIVTGKTRTGPYDLIALVRKIRNGTVTAQSHLQQGEETPPLAAQQWPELVEFFEEKKDERPGLPDRGHQSKGLIAALKSGTNFLSRNHYTTVYSGLLVLAILLLTAFIASSLPEGVSFIGFILCFVLGHMLISCYMLSVLRMARGQPVDATYMGGKIVPALGKLFASSFFISIPALLGLVLVTADTPPIVMLVGLFIFAVPGLLVLAIYAYTPLLILDKGHNVWESMELSRKAVFSGGFENTGVIYALYVINFLAGLCILLPMALTLPIMMGALSESYDESFA